MARDWLRRLRRAQTSHKTSRRSVEAVLPFPSRARVQSPYTSDRSASPSPRRRRRRRGVSSVSRGLGASSSPSPSSSSSSSGASRSSSSSSSSSARAATSAPSHSSSSSCRRSRRSRCGAARSARSRSGSRGAPRSARVGPSLRLVSDGARRSASATARRPAVPLRVSLMDRWARPASARTAPAIAATPDDRSRFQDLGGNHIFTRDGFGSSAVLRELEGSNRNVQRSAESTSIWPS